MQKSTPNKMLRHKLILSTKSPEAFLVEIKLKEMYTELDATYVSMRPPWKTKAHLLTSKASCFFWLEMNLNCLQIAQMVMIVATTMKKHDTYWSAKINLRKI